MRGQNGHRSTPNARASSPGALAGRQCTQSGQRPALPTSWAVWETKASGVVAALQGPSLECSKNSVGRGV